ncbi:MAG: Bpu10I family restriction endonuclease [Firmicutes bacterium]|nr:Bpu10I family restriction endonuclease [Bacillota bacterium]
MNTYFYHGNNIINKIKTNYGALENELEPFYTHCYQPFHTALMKIDGIEDASVCEKVRILNVYYNDVEEFERRYAIKSQSKFRSTILEEFNGYLFKDLPEIKELQLDFFNKGIYAGLKIDHRGQIAILTKDVDFCIGKRFVLTLDRQHLEVIIPLVAVEVKTYLDATMYNEVQYSMQTIKNATPNVRAYLLMERNEVKEDKIIASKADSPLDEIFVVRGRRDHEIDDKTVYQFYSEVCTTLRTNLKTGLKMPGRLFNP